MARQPDFAHWQSGQPQTASQPTIGSAGCRDDFRPSGYPDRPTLDQLSLRRAFDLLNRVVIFCRGRIVGDASKVETGGKYLVFWCDG